MSVSVIFLCISNRQHDMWQISSKDQKKKRRNPKFKEFSEYFPLPVARAICFNMIYKYIAYVKLSVLEEYHRWLNTGTE